MKTRLITEELIRRGSGERAEMLFMCLLITIFSVTAAEQKIPGTLPQPDRAGNVLQPGTIPNSRSDNSVKLAGLSAITNVTAAREDKDLVVTVATQGPAEYKVFALENPSRLVIDFMNADCKVPFIQLPVDSPAVKRLRVHQFQASDPKVARLVVDFEGDSWPHEIRAEKDALQIFFHAPEKASGVKPALPAEKNSAGRQGMAHPAAKRQAGPESGFSMPVIRDLAVSEIPQSALAEARPAAQVPPPVEPNGEQKAFSPAPPPASPPPLRSSPPDRSAGPGALPAQGRYAGQPLTLDLVDIPLIDFFRLMAEEGGINIVMDPEIQGKLSIKVVKVPWDQIFDAALANNNLDKKVEGNLVRIASKQTLQNEAKQQEALKKANLLAAELETRVKKLNYAKAPTIVGTLADQKTVRGTVVVDERTNSLILTDVPYSLDKMIELIEKLDIPQPQVEIEARIVSATRDFARDIGIQFGFVQGNLDRVTVGGPNTFGTIGGTRPSATPTSTYAAGNSRTGRGASESTASESAGVSTGATGTNAGNFNVNLPSQLPFGGIGLSVGNIFDTFLLDAAITAGENKGLAKLISQPKLTTHNNSPGTITQGLRFPVQIIANNTVAIQFQNAALTLTVTPQITSEGNVVLDLKVENNTPDFSRQVNGIPSIRTSEATTRVLVRDGGTTVIGGILIENETSQEDRVPGLASLPMIGNLFRRTSVSRSTEEVLFFITPRVIR